MIISTLKLIVYSSVEIDFFIFKLDRTRFFLEVNIGKFNFSLNKKKDNGSFVCHEFLIGGLRVICFSTMVHVSLCFNRVFVCNRCF